MRSTDDGLCLVRSFVEVFAGAHVQEFAVAFVVDHDVFGFQISIDNILPV
jgi:hypothetical protein